MRASISLEVCLCSSQEYLSAFPQEKEFLYPPLVYVSLQLLRQPTLSVASTLAATFLGLNACSSITIASPHE